MDFLYHFLKDFVSLTVLVFPYFLFGAIFAALLEAYLNPNYAIKYLNKGIRSVVIASLLGAVLPGCSCATMPMAEGLKRKGGSLGTISAFIMISPLIAPHTVILTYGMLGLKFTVARIFFSLAGAIILGLLFNYLENKKIKGFTLPSDNSSHKECSSSCSTECHTEEKVGFLKSLLNILKGLGGYFLLGMFIASILTTFVPEEAIPQYIGKSGVFAYAMAVLIGIPIYVCEGEEIPITLSLLKLGLGAGPAFSFLLGSVGTCIPTMIMAQKIIGKRPTFYYIIGWFVFAIGSGLLFSLLF